MNNKKLNIKAIVLQYENVSKKSLKRVVKNISI